MVNCLFLRINRPDLGNEGRGGVCPASNTPQPERCCDTQLFNGQACASAGSFTACPWASGQTETCRSCSPDLLRFPCTPTHTQAVKVLWKEVLQAAGSEMQAGSWLTVKASSAHDTALACPSHGRHLQIVTCAARPVEKKAYY